MDKAEKVFEKLAGKYQNLTTTLSLGGTVAAPSYLGYKAEREGGSNLGLATGVGASAGAGHGAITKKVVKEVDPKNVMGVGKLLDDVPTKLLTATGGLGGALSGATYYGISKLLTPERSKKSKKK